MNIALIGATGHVGSRILDEALARGHETTADSKIRPRPALVSAPDSLRR